MRNVAFVTTICLALAACTPTSRSGEILVTDAGLTLAFASNSDQTPRDMGRAQVTPDDRVSCTFTGTSPDTGQPVQTTQNVIAPGIFQRLSAVVSPPASTANGQNGNSGLGQRRTAPYRSPPGQIIALLNATLAPAPCMPAN